MRWTNITTCSFSWFKSLTYLSLGISKVYCLWYGSQWSPGLATKNPEWVWDNSYDTWNFPARQAINVQTCSVLRWRSRWTFWVFSSTVRENRASESLCSYNILFSYSGIDSTSEGSNVHFSFVLCVWNLETRCKAKSIAILTVHQPFD
jgi:hypothetical protein